MVNATDFGAKGDGSTDCTEALRAALQEAGKTGSAVFLSEGTYRTGSLHLPPYTGLIGTPTWGYRSNGGTILQLNDAQVRCLIDLTGSQGATLNGLCLEGDRSAGAAHGVMVDHPQFGEFGKEEAFRIERCRIEGFAGTGVFLNRVWCYSIRHSMIAHNKGDGIYQRGWDSFILDNWLAGNEGAGFAAREENASCTFTGNRVEWNFGAGVEIHGGDHYNLTGNFIDRSGGPGIDIQDRDGVPASHITVTGNVLYRNGKPNRGNGSSRESTHIRCRNSRGIVISANVGEVAADDPNDPDRSPATSPDYGIVYGGLKNCIIKDNVFDNGYKEEMLLDLGDHDGGNIVKDNIGCAYDSLVRPDMA